MLQKLIYPLTLSCLLVNNSWLIGMPINNLTPRQQKVVSLKEDIDYHTGRTCFFLYVAAINNTLGDHALFCVNPYNSPETNSTLLRISFASKLIASLNVTRSSYELLCTYNKRTALEKIKIEVAKELLNSN